MFKKHFYLNCSILQLLPCHFHTLCPYCLPSSTLHHSNSTSLPVNICMPPCPSNVSKLFLSRRRLVFIPFHVTNCDTPYIYSHNASINMQTIFANVYEKYCATTRYCWFLYYILCCYNIIDNIHQVRTNRD